jgi:hypothetical protein
MAKGKLMRELLIHHLRYEIDMLRCTFGRLHNPLLHECDKSAPSSNRSAFMLGI